MTKIAIFGAGLAGAYLYNRLKAEGFNTYIWDNHKIMGTKLGCSCACGIPREGFTDYCEITGLTAGDYIITHLTHASLNGTDCRSNELIVFDKQKFVKDLLGNAIIRPITTPLKKFDYVIDATGFSRAILPKISTDYIGTTWQVLTKFPHGLMDFNTFYINFTPFGYIWAFPYRNELWHVGFGVMGSGQYDAFKYSKDMMGLLYKTGKPICSCLSHIRVTPIHLAKPITYKNIWGVGEAIGVVSPLAGDGNLPSLLTADLLLSRIHYEKSQESYEEILLYRFGYLKNEFVLGQKMLEMKRINLYKYGSKIIKLTADRLGITLPKWFRGAEFRLDMIINMLDQYELMGRYKEMM